MTAREKILGRIRAQKKRGPLAGADADLLKQRIADHARNIVPERSRLPKAGQVDLFQTKMEGLGATTERVASAADIPARIRDYLSQKNLPTRIKVSPSEILTGLGWDTVPMIEVVVGAGTEEDMVGLSPAFAGIAETGTLMMLSGPETPSTVNFLPENHIAVLKVSDMVGAFEEAWDALRAAHGEALPRTVNLISGPSRTADIEQTLIMGAHGPKTLHVILVEDGT
ncbi:LutC/YkgG family protein [Sneathiella chinensis]|uniref:LUD domain-containing protein n=1 Tax=Sneathiella chinensis TaxID=349750 RepID=A0ABQ5U0I0_9PROT|nr:LUD domain-containing protein [Sneathiella chinensis]GLQ04926.1 hypothetical protein GCM10007924_01470 [Sneathiella chinensis]